MKNKTVLGQNSYGWVLVNITCFLVTPALAGFAILFDLLLFVLLEEFYPIFSTLAFIYALARAFLGYQYLHSPVKKDAGIYLRLDEVEESLIYNAFSVIVPKNYKLQIFRTVGTPDSATISIYKRDKTATIYLQEEEFLVLKHSKEEEAIMLPIIVRRAYLDFKIDSVLSTVHAQGLLKRVGDTLNKHDSKRETENYIRTGMIVGLHTGGGTGGALLGGAASAFISGLPLVILAFFTLASYLYALIIILTIWLFQFPYNQQISERLKEDIYNPIMRGKEKKYIRKLKLQTLLKPRILSENNDDYAKEVGWTLTI